MSTRRLFRSRPPQGVQVRTTVLSVQRDDSTSKQIALSDEFVSFMGAHGANILIPTPYQVGRLFELIDRSNILRQCIEAYVTNTVGTGWEVGPVIREREPTSADAIELQSFIDHANSEQSLSAVMKQVIWDRECVGFGFKEVIRDAAGRIALFRWAPALYTRLCVKHPTPQLVEYDIPRGQRTVTVKEYRLFRRYVQIVNGKQRWFKEYGDPRRMDFETGAFEGEDGYQASRQASEIFHYKCISNESYGVPRWISQLPSIIGSREAEEVNMRYFQDNTVPPMLLTVAGGRLTAQSYEQLTKTLNQDGLGKDRQNRIMLLEAVGEGDSITDKGSSVQLKVDKLTDTRQSDALFADYDKANQDKIRSSFRLPPVSVGASQDVNFATANVSQFVAESQVYAPARAEIDEIENKQFVNGKKGLNLRSAKLVSRTPAITAPELMLKALTALNVMGAVTPRSAQKVANTMLQVELPQYPKKGEADYEAWMDQPIVFATRQGFDQNGNPLPENTQAEQAVKDEKTKETEATGETQQPPKHGEE